MPVPVFTTGEVLTAANMNAVGLWRVTGCTVTSVGGTAATASNGVITVGTGNTSVTVNSAFSADYVNYRIVVSNVDFSVADNAVAFTLGSSTASYYSASRYFSYAGGTIEVNRNNAASAYLVASAANNDTNFSFDVFQPFLANLTTWSGSGFTHNYNIVFGGLHGSATSYTSFTIAPITGTMTGGTIRVYGYRN